MAAFVDFTVAAIGAIFRGRPARAHLVVELVAIDPFWVNGISPVNGQEEVLAGRSRLSPAAECHRTISLWLGVRDHGAAAYSVGALTSHGPQNQRV